MHRVFLERSQLSWHLCRIGRGPCLQISDSDETYYRILVVRPSGLSKRLKSEHIITNSTDFRVCDFEWDLVQFTSSTGSDYGWFVALFLPENSSQISIWMPWPKGFAKLADDHFRTYNIENKSVIHLFNLLATVDEDKTL